MQRKDIEAAAASVTYMRGLLALPLGAVFILIGLGNLQWGPFRFTWVFLLCLAAAAAGWVLINGYYNDNFGRVTAGDRRQARYAVPYVLYAVAMIGGPLLEQWLDPRVSLFAALFAVAALSWYALRVRLRAHHYIVWGALLVVALLPIWGSLDDSISTAFLPIGVAVIVSGVLDHRTLVERFGPAKDPANDPARESSLGGA